MKNNSPNTKKTSFLLISILCFTTAISFVICIQKGKTAISIDELETYKELKLSADAKFERTTGRGATWWIDLKSDSFPSLFRIHAPVGECTSWKQLLKEFKKDSLATISILKKDVINLGYGSELGYVAVYGLSKGEWFDIHRDCFNYNSWNYVLISIFLSTLLGLLAFYLSLRKQAFLISGEEVKPLGFIFLLALAILLGIGSIFW